MNKGKILGKYLYIGALFSLANTRLALNTARETNNPVYFATASKKKYKYL
jgi:hypothetical protein